MCIATLLFARSLKATQALLLVEEASVVEFQRWTAAVDDHQAPRTGLRSRPLRQGRRSRLRAIHSCARRSSGVGVCLQSHSTPVAGPSRSGGLGHRVENHLEAFDLRLSRSPRLGRTLARSLYRLLALAHRLLRLPKGHSDRVAALAVPEHRHPLQPIELLEGGHVLALKPSGDLVQRRRVHLQCGHPRMHWPRLRSLAATLSHWLHSGQTKRRSRTLALTACSLEGGS